MTIGPAPMIRIERMSVLLGMLGLRVSPTPGGADPLGFSFGKSPRL